MIVMKEMLDYEKKIKKMKMSNLKVVMRLKTPLCFSQFVPLDGIVSYCVMAEYFGDIWENAGENKDEVWYIPIPIAETGVKKKYYLASCGIFDGVKSKQFWSKRLYSEDCDREMFRGEDRYNIPLVLTDTKEIRFYCVGNKKELLKVLRHCRYIGKKRSQGYGKISDIYVEDIEDDYSVWYNNILMRVIPLTEIEENVMSKVDNDNNKIQYCSYRPPYWHKENFDICLVPWGVK